MGLSRWLPSQETRYIMTSWTYFVMRVSRGSRRQAWISSAESSGWPAGSLCSVLAEEAPRFGLFRFERKWRMRLGGEAEGLCGRGCNHSSGSATWDLLAVRGGGRE